VVRAALFVLLARPIVTTVLAQDAVRMSAAGAQAAQAHDAAVSTPGYYNLQVGPTYWRFSAGLNLQYNDNIYLVQNGQQGDFLYIPSATVQLMWPISSIQRLNITIGAGYDGYVRETTNNRAYIAPDSEVSFDVYAGDFRIDLHDHFSITESSYEDPTVVGSASYSQFQNSVGIGVLWDLNKVTVNAGYDHASYLELSGGLGQSDETSEVFSASAGYTIKPGMVFGLQFGGALQDYSTPTTNTPYAAATEWNAGSFFRTQVTKNISLNASAGYVVNSPQGGSALPTATAFSGYYGSLAITHRVNQFVTYSLGVARNLSTGLVGGAVDSYTANFSAGWNIFQKLSLATSFIYDRGSQVGVLGGETFDQYGPDIRLSRAITKKLSSSLGYQFYERGSNLPGRAYSLNVVSVNFIYRF
jgi:hypothetical protein